MSAPNKSPLFCPWYEYVISYCSFFSCLWQFAVGIVAIWCESPPFQKLEGSLNIWQMLCWPNQFQYFQPNWPIATAFSAKAFNSVRHNEEQIWWSMALAARPHGRSAQMIFWQFGTISFIASWLSLVEGKNVFFCFWSVFHVQIQSKLQMDFNPLPALWSECPTRPRF